LFAPRCSTLVLAAVGSTACCTTRRLLAKSKLLYNIDRYSTADCCIMVNHEGQQACFKQVQPVG
jgi:hypothetical protein